MVYNKLRPEVNKGVNAMRTQKRDKIDRAYSLGYKAGIRGRSVDNCPFSIAEKRGPWMGGWRDGRNDFVSGYPDVEAV
jgi:ribosome modulation factor